MSPCGGCELGDEDLTSVKYCMVDLTQTDNSQYLKCYTPTNPVHLLSFDCAIDMYVCDHGRGCGPHGECLCEPNEYGSECQKVLLAYTPHTHDPTFNYGIVIGCVVTSVIFVLIGIAVCITIVRCKLKKKKTDSVTEIDGPSVELIEAVPSE